MKFILKLIPIVIAVAVLSYGGILFLSDNSEEVQITIGPWQSGLFKLGMVVITSLVAGMLFIAVLYILALTPLLISNRRLKKRVRELEEQDRVRKELELRTPQVEEDDDEKPLTAALPPPVGTPEITEVDEKNSDSEEEKSPDKPKDDSVEEIEAMENDLDGEFSPEDAFRSDSKKKKEDTEEDPDSNRNLPTNSGKPDDHESIVHRHESLKLRAQAPRGF